MRVHIFSNSPAYPTTGSGYANIVKNISFELSKPGYDIAITGMQTSYEMGNIGKIPIYPLLPDFHAVDSLNMQLRQLSLNMKYHGSDILLCIFQGDSKWYNPFTQIIPDKTVWMMPLEGEIIYKNHQVWNDARKVKKVVAMTNSAGEQFRKQGISCDVIYLGYNPKAFRKEYNKNLQESIIIYFPANNEELILPACKLPEWKEKMGIECMFGFNAQNFGVKKRFERLIEAFSIFAKDKNDVHLHLHTLPVGVKGLNLLEIINYYDIKDKITFSYGNFGSSGWSEHALNILYNQFDIYVSASSGEGFGLPILESAAVGVPQIHPDFAPFNEFLGHDEDKRGLLAKCIKQFTSAGEERALVDIQSLAEKMEIMYTQDDFREMLGRNAQKWASEYTWARTAREFDKVFKDM